MPPVPAQHFDDHGPSPNPPVFADLAGVLTDTRNRNAPTGAAGWFTSWLASCKGDRLAVLLIELDRVSLVQAVVENGPDTTVDRVSKHLEKALPYGSYLERIGVDLFLAHDC